MQIMPFEEAADYRFNPFDVTKVWPHADYPPITIGRHGARPQPGEPLRRGRAGGVRARRTSCPGIGLSPDKMLMGRIFSYHDAHLHRIGAELRAAADQPAAVARCTATTRTAR